MSTDRLHTRPHVHRRGHRLQHVEIAAIVEVPERKGLCTKQAHYDIIAEFRRKNPLLNLAARDAEMVQSPGSERSYKKEERA